MFYSFRLNLHFCTSTGKFVCNIIYRLKYVLKPSIANIAYGFADPLRRYINTFHTAVTLLGVCGIQHWTKIGAGGHLPHVLKADAFQRVRDSDDFPTAGRDSIMHRRSARLTMISPFAALTSMAMAHSTCSG